MNNEYKKIVDAWMELNPWYQFYKEFWDKNPWYQSFKDFYK